MSIFPNKKIQRDSEQDGLKSEFKKKNLKFLQGFVETAALLI